MIIGAIISAALLVADTITEGDWLDAQMPGISAAYLFCGAVSPYVLPSIIICWLVNAVIYAVPAFVVVMLLKLLAPAERPYEHVSAFWILTSQPSSVFGAIRMYGRSTRTGRGVIET